MLTGAAAVDRPNPIEEGHATMSTTGNALNHDDAALVYHETAHNTFMMMDSDGKLVYRIKDGSAPVIIESAQIIARSQFLRRSMVELTVKRAMRRLLETAPSEAMQKVLALLDENLPPLPTPTPLVRIEHNVCDDRVDRARFGTEIGTNVCITAGDEEVLLYFPDKTEDYNVPTLFAFDVDGLPLDRVERVLSLIQAVLSDSRVQALRAGLPMPQLAPTVR